MAVEPSKTDGMMDLEKELSCSICTDVLYQPLTLLDCLHTFCGSCLKEWFTWQASSATTSLPYTCPSCRASVRDTRPNATVTTLLEMFLKAHPIRLKTLEERKEIEKAYKTGDNVIPPLDLAPEPEDSEDERMLAEARELSLNDTDPERIRRRTERAALRARHRTRQTGHASDRSLPSSAEERRRNQQRSERRSAQRGIEHQSSLRSLLSASELDSQGMEEEIMQQIMDEGLLEGIDLHSLTPAQEEEITERIAHAFRRRKQQQQRARHVNGRRAEDRSSQPPSQPAVVAHRHHAHSRSESTSTNFQGDQRSRPSPSHPQLLDVVNDDSRQHRYRSSSQSSNLSVQHADAVVTSAIITNQAASRSATDLTGRHVSNPHERPRPSRAAQSGRRTTDVQAHGAAIRASRDRAASGQSLGERGNSSTEDYVGSEDRLSNRSLVTPQVPFRVPPGPHNGSVPNLAAPAEEDTGRRSAERTSRALSSGPAPDTWTAARSSPTPSVACSRCEKPDIQYNLHYRCRKCSSGNFNLCLACYRTGKGCLHWYGFGSAALARYQRAASANGPHSDQESPHILDARRYQQSGTEQSQVPAARLEEGLFCEGCLTSADSCYWHCETCNDGAWGYCNACVSHGKHCTHPLKAVGRKTSTKPGQAAYAWSEHKQELHPAPLSIKTSPLAKTSSSQNAIASLPHASDPSLYALITLPFNCALCARSVPPSHTRFHCSTCNAGNYDICTPCYHALLTSGKLSAEDGPQGWRRCPQGHRMSVIGFEDREGGARRIVVREPVGGLALKEERAEGSPRAAKWSWRESDGSPAEYIPSVDVGISGSGVRQQQRSPRSSLPPDGGGGMRVVALWSYFPEGVADELAFPRGAEIREVEDINRDWFWGVYAGNKGLFPGNYTRGLGS